MMDALKAVCKAFEVTKAGFGPLCRENCTFCCSFVYEEVPTGRILGPSKPGARQRLLRVTSVFCKENEVLVCKSNSLGVRGWGDVR